MLNIIRELASYQQLVQHLGSESKKVEPLALIRPARLPVSVSLWQDLHLPIILVTTKTDIAQLLLDEWVFWAPDSRPLLFSEPNPLFYEHASWSDSTRWERITALGDLACYHLPGSLKPELPPVIIAPIRAIMTRTIPRRDFLKSCHAIRVDQKTSLEKLVREWVQIGYEPSEMVIERGYFARRGGILDIWPPSEKLPVRIEFFGDEVDSLRAFDPATQRTVVPCSSVFITPARESLPNKMGVEKIINGLPTSEEFAIPLVYKSSASILDYLPKPALVLIDDMDALSAVAAEVEEKAVQIRQDMMQDGILTEEFPVPYLSWSEILDVLDSTRWIDMGGDRDEESDTIGNHFSSSARFGGKIQDALEAILQNEKSQQKTWIVSKQIARIKGLWQEFHQKIQSIPIPHFVGGVLSSGFSIRLNTQKSVHLITDNEIFGWERPKPRAVHHPIVEPTQIPFFDFSPGDLVVHIDYGIGRYAGMVKRSLEGIEKEYFCIEYEDDAQIFVPVYQAERLTRYVGASGEGVHLSHIGGTEWSSTKQRVRKAVEEIAKDFLELYARRQLAQGFAFRPDVPWQAELEASFPYIETADQNQAIQDIKRDMEKPRPMDRLLCGDVGFGKTEVALRAAFKAVMDSKQVAILVPTTILAQQHYETFLHRLAVFPIELEMLSRFRTPKEQDEIINKIREGTVDIVIGTHRLLQSDVRFKDLGLVIIDEEQRFGVTHKEHFKKLRHEVDVLTLTATPIPRTLYMALTGVKDISTINTPPEDRMSVITHVGPYSPKLVRHAILRELDRGGQIFYLHNRIHSLCGVEQHLQNLVPGLRIGIAHGQMHETFLSSVMQKFSRQEIDVLLCTTIIESGLDFPNANTLIVDRGDTFGLAQLYQLRGRVGRGSQRAYAYFFRHGKKAPTAEGLERLKTIAENTQLGAGYSIALRDLEIRGAGELLGTQQHGYMASVGFQLYASLLSEAVRSLKKEQGDSVPDMDIHPFEKMQRLPVTVDLPLAIGIPTDYVIDQKIRLQLYRRMSDFTLEDEVELFRKELLDRFGEIPSPLQFLLYQLKIKILAERVGLASIYYEVNQVVFQFPDVPENHTARSLPEIGGKVRSGKNSYRLPIPIFDEDGMELLSTTLHAIIEKCKKY